MNPFTLDVVDRNVNSITAHTAHLAFVWAPMDELRVTPSFTYQDRDEHDSPSFYVALSDPPEGVLRSGKLLQQPTDDKLMIGALNAIYDFAGLELTSGSCYLHRHVFSITDGTNNGIGWGNPQGPEYPENDQTYLRETNTLRQTQWGQELRLATPDSHRRVGWLVGAFVLHATYSEETTTNPVENADGVQIGGGDQIYSGYENHLALFGDLILQLSERLTARVGLRLTHATYSGTISNSGTLSGEESPAAPRITLSYQASPETLYYATVSTGYRLGGLNPPIQPWCSVKFAPSYGPDWVINYELGAKASLFDGRTTIDGSRVSHAVASHADRSQRA